MQKKRVASPRRALRDAKAAELRARLGAAKAQLAETHARVTAESQQTNKADDNTLPIVTPDFDAAEEVCADDEAVDLPMHSAEAPVADPQARHIEDANGGEVAVKHSEPGLPAEQGEGDPIRTLTIARLLAGQGYFERSLSIFDELLTQSDDPELHAEAARVRAKLASG